jgi:DNA (cytosine-5)-methyltransferase 1
VRRPLLLDAFCKAGGAGMGYFRAGFEVVGVDIEPQPNYPFPFIQADAIAFIKAFAWMFDVLTGSPPCHDHTTLKSRAGTNGTGWLLEATRDVFEASGKPYVIENVPGSPMRADAIYCGEMFDLRTVRHRWFETNTGPIEVPPHPLGDEHPRRHLRKTSTLKRRKCLAAGHNISVTGDVGSYLGEVCMGVTWMTGNELSQAIPPAYTEHLGRQLIGRLS